MHEVECGTRLTVVVLVCKSVVDAVAFLSFW